MISPRPLRPLRSPAALWHLATAAAVGTGLVWQIVLSIRGVNVLVDATGAVPGLGTRLVRFFSYFTVESNILVLITALTLMIRPDRDGPWWRIARLEALFGIAVTGVVYSTLLRGVVDLHGAAAVTNALLHYVGPVMAVLGWLLFGPRPRITENTLVLSLIWPAAYVVWGFAYGGVTDWYPYPFIDVTKLGYVTVIRNGIALNLLLVGVGALFMWLDHHLPAAPGRAGGTETVGPLR